MFHSSTTRDFMNGTNYKGNTPYEPQISSFDYDAPLDEAGNATHKFMEFRKVVEKHLPAGKKLPEVPDAKPAIAILSIQLSQSTSLFNLLPQPKLNPTPLTFEDLNLAYVYVRYRTTLNNASPELLKIKDLRDYGFVFLNGKRAGVLDGRLAQDSMQLEVPKGRGTLDIFVENMGHINFGPYLLQNKKGITEKVMLAGKKLKGWQMYSLPFDNILTYRLTGKAGVIPVDGRTNTKAPVLKTGSFNLNEVGDTYLDMRNWGKGVGID